jgi:hypothetical protein
MAVKQLDIIKNLSTEKLARWSKEEIKILIKVASTEIREWERIKAEAERYL